MYLNPSINETTIVSSGLQISKNFIVGHVSSGAYHYVLGRIVPSFTSFLLPGNTTLPTWQVAKNLQLGSQGILENLLEAFGSDLIIRSGFMGRTGLSFNQSIDTLAKDAISNIQYNRSAGQTFDVQIRGYESNMFNVTDIFKKLCGKANGMELLYGNTSAIRINFDEHSILKNASDIFQGSMVTKDLIGGVIEEGLTSIRGIF